MTIKHLYISLFTIVTLVTSMALFSIQDQTNRYSLITKKENSIAGDTVELRFSFKGSKDVTLYCSNSYGSILLDPLVRETELIFTIPDMISKKAGLLSWELISDTTKTEGQITIKPKAKINTIESYLGPPSIEAGGSDYTMLVVIPTDDLDNPLTDSTKVVIKHQFLSNLNNSEISTKHGFAYKNIYSETKSGRILISSESLGLNSKEYDVNVVPAIPSDFEINAERIHDYADGNQITTFKTSILKDRYNNTVSDGTFVTFFITNKKGYKSKTSGTTINGVASAKMLHPDHEEEWTIKAYVEGMANSKIIVLKYKQAISDFDVTFFEGNRIISVGPLKSFMSQRIPDGLRVQLLVYKNGLLLDTITENSLNGIAKFYLNKDRFPEDIYDLELNAAGITKIFKEVHYE